MNFFFKKRRSLSSFALSFLTKRKKTAFCNHYSLWVMRAIILKGTCLSYRPWLCVLWTNSLPWEGIHIYLKCWVLTGNKIIVYCSIHTWCELHRLMTMQLCRGWESNVFVIFHVAITTTTTTKRLILFTSTNIQCLQV